MKQRSIRLFKATALLGSVVFFASQLGILAYKWLCGVQALSHLLEKVRNGAYHSYTSTFLYLLYALDAGLLIYLAAKLGQFVWKGNSVNRSRGMERQPTRSVAHQKVRLYRPKLFSALPLSKKAL